MLLKLKILFFALLLSGCSSTLNVAVESAQERARKAADDLRNASMAGQCEVRTTGSWFRFFAQSPQIACLEWKACLLYHNAKQSPAMPECES